MKQSVQTTIFFSLSKNIKIRLLRYPHKFGFYLRMLQFHLILHISEQTTKCLLSNSYNLNKQITTSMFLIMLHVLQHNCTILKKIDIQE
jgi:hypothetical protein